MELHDNQSRETGWLNWW